MTAPSDDPTGGMEPIRQIAHQMEEERRKAEKVENCGNCRFWISQDCRRYPPQMTMWATDNQHPLTYVAAPTWPQTSRDDWCGEWKDRADGE